MLVLLLLVGLSSASPPVFDHGVDLPTHRPLNIAHRGFSGVYPEHTKPAYEYAIESGADIIECDLCLTRDLRLICLHESWISGLTNISSIYPEERMNTYFVPDKDRFINDFFTVDFTLEELKKVGVRQRDGARDKTYDYQFQITTLAEYIEIAQNAGRPVGIYPETKEPRFMNGLDIVQEANTTFEDLLLAELGSYGYSDSRDPCFIQSLNADSIRYMAERTNLPLIVLIYDTTIPPTNSTLEDYASFAYGIGPNKRLIILANAQNQRVAASDLSARAQAYGLRVHPFTLRNENSQLLWDYEQDPYLEFADYLDVGVDGVFTDFPGSYNKFLEAVYQ